MESIQATHFSAREGHWQEDMGLRDEHMQKMAVVVPGCPP